MGAWGAGIFSDDTAADIRSDYRELLEDQVPDDEATRRIVVAYQDLDDDEEHVLWLALAAAQSKFGRLDAEVKSRALNVIDNGRGLQSWQEAGPKELTKRQAALAKLRAELTGPQPARKTVRRPWRHETDLRPGDVLSYTASNGSMALLRVLRVDDHRLGAAPIVEWLDWTGQSLPAGWRMRRLEARPGPQPVLRGVRGPATYRVSRHRKKDPDWHDSGFTLAARLPPRPQDAIAQARTYTAWQNLSGTLERQLRG
jgi:hypothetical protein